MTESLLEDDQYDVAEIRDTQHKSAGGSHDGTCNIADGSYFIKNAYVSIREEAEEGERYMVYVPQDESIMLINRIGLKIVQLCNGTLSIRDITSVLKNEYSVSQEIDLHATVRGFVKALALAHIIYPTTQKEQINVQAV